MFDHSDKNDYDIPTNVIKAFTEGDCWLLAATLHSITKWPIVTMSEEENRDYWCHVAVMTPSGTILDIQGEWFGSDWADYWGEHYVDSANSYEWPENDFEEHLIRWPLERDFTENPVTWAETLRSKWLASMRAEV